VTARAGLVAFGAVLAVAGLLLALAAGPIALQLTFSGVVLILGVLFERQIYKRVETAKPAEPGWQRTDERFVDPTTGQSVTVFTQPATGERRYVDTADDGRTSR
jgi:membrane protein implicated in regulation of membrane protease activity